MEPLIATAWVRRAGRTVDYGGYTDTACYVASWSSPDPSAPVVDCVVDDHTAGDYKVVIVFHYQDGQWVPIASNSSDSSTWLETSADVSGGSPTWSWRARLSSL